jgi:hypothetical protein
MPSGARNLSSIEAKPKSFKFPELFANHLRSFLHSGVMGLPQIFRDSNFSTFAVDAVQRRSIWATWAAV